MSQVHVASIPALGGLSVFYTGLPRFPIRPLGRWSTLLRAVPAFPFIRLVR